MSIVKSDKIKYIDTCLLIHFVTSQQLRKAFLRLFLNHRPHCYTHLSIYPWPSPLSSSTHSTHSHTSCLNYRPNVSLTIFQRSQDSFHFDQASFLCNRLEQPCPSLPKTGLNIIPSDSLLIELPCTNFSSGVCSPGQSLGAISPFLPFRISVNLSCYCLLKSPSIFSTYLSSKNFLFLYNSGFPAL